MAEWNSRARLKEEMATPGPEIDLSHFRELQVGPWEPGLVS